MRIVMNYDKEDLVIKRGIDSISNRLYVARTMIPKGYERYFQESAQYISAHTSTAIEGNPLDEKRAMIVMVEGADPTKPAEVEKVNLSEAYELMDIFASDPTTRVDAGIIRTINSMVLRGLPDSQARNRGRYRPGASLIVDAQTREIRYRPPRAEWVPELMENLVADLGGWSREGPAPITAALVHFGLISIHPFEDGNGRTARLVADMLLRLAGSSADGMVSVSEAIHRKVAEYYRTLREAQGLDFQQTVDVTPFVRFHTEALGEAAVRLEEKAIRFAQQRDQLANQAKGKLNERQVTGLMSIVDLGPISSSHYARLTGGSQATALADLNDLIEKGIVRKAGAGKNTRYKLSARSARSVGDAE